MHKVDNKDIFYSIGKYSHYSVKSIIFKNNEKNIVNKLYFNKKQIGTEAIS